MKKLIIFSMLLILSFTAKAQYTFQENNCRIEVVSNSEVRTSFLVDEVRWVDRGGSQITVFDYKMSITLRSSQIDNFATLALLKTQIDTWKAACNTTGAAGSIFGTNGVSNRNDSTVILGGTLDAATTIALGGNTFGLTGTGEFNSAFSMPNGNEYERHIGNNFFGFLDASGESINYPSSNVFYFEAVGDLSPFGLTSASYRKTYGIEDTAQLDFIVRVDPSTDLSTTAITNTSSGATTADFVISSESLNSSMAKISITGKGNNNKSNAAVMASADAGVTYNGLRAHPDDWVVFTNTSNDLYRFPYTQGSGGQYLAFDVSDSSMTWTTDINIANANLTADSNRTLTLNDKLLTISQDSASLEVGQYSFTWSAPISTTVVNTGAFFTRNVAGERYKAGMGVSRKNGATGTGMNLVDTVENRVHNIELDNNSAQLRFSDVGGDGVTEFYIENVGDEGVLLIRQSEDTILYVDDNEVNLVPSGRPLVIDLPSNGVNKVLIDTDGNGTAEWGDVPSILTGWAQYNDTLVTRSSPQSILTTDTAMITNDAHTVIDTYKPTAVTELYNSSTGIQGELGATYTVRINFDAKTSSVTDYANLIFDIGADDNNPNVITSKVFTFPKGQNTWHTFSETISIYALSTFVSNGCEVKLVAGNGTLDVANISFLITKTTHPNN